MARRLGVITIKKGEALVYMPYNHHEGFHEQFKKRYIMHFGHFSKTRSVCLARGIN